MSLPKRQRTTGESSSLLSRLACFLPQIAEANRELEGEGALKGRTIDEGLEPSTEGGENNDGGDDKVAGSMDRDMNYDYDIKMN